MIRLAFPDCLCGIGYERLCNEEQSNEHRAMRYCSDILLRKTNAIILRLDPTFNKKMNRKLNIFPVGFPARGKMWKIALRSELESQT